MEDREDREVIINPPIYPKQEVAGVYVFLNRLFVRLSGPKYVSPIFGTATYLLPLLFRQSYLVFRTQYVEVRIIWKFQLIFFLRIPVLFKFRIMHMILSFE